MSAVFTQNASNYLSIASDLGITGSNERTILVWAKCDKSLAGGDGAAGLAPLGFQNAGDTKSARLRFVSTDDTLQYYSPSGADQIGTATYNESTWYCFYWRWNHTAKAYEAGVAAEGLTSFTQTDSGVLGADYEAWANCYIGKLDTGGSYPFSGKIACVRVWSERMSDVNLNAELTATSIAPVRSTNLRADWRFGSGAITTDSSGNGYTLTQTGTVNYDAEQPTWASGASAAGKIASRHLAAMRRH